MSNNEPEPYDFDEMALAFGKMKGCFRAYQEGRTESQLDAYLLASARFYARYPNPFSGHDDNFLPGAKVESGQKSTAPNLSKLRANEKALITKLDNLIKAQAGAEEYERWESLLRKTRAKIQELTFT